MQSIAEWVCLLGVKHWGFSKSNFGKIQLSSIGGE